MGSNSVEAGKSDHHHVVTIWEVNKDRVELMQKKMNDPPKLLTKAAGKSSCCIFRVPQSFIDINGKSFQPRVVSIGPYHRGEPHLQMFEEHKWRYLGFMISRLTQDKASYLEHLLRSLEPLEMQARECYAENIDLNIDEFVEMLVLDGCFIIELFRKVREVVAVEADDPIFTMSWVIPFFHRDFLRLENQIPSFVLERLFELTRTPEESGLSLSMLALNFFNYAMLRPDAIIDCYKDLKGSHLLDLVRSSYIQFEGGLPQNEHTIATHTIHCVSKLRRAGIKLKRGKAESFLEVKFGGGVIEMPTITIDDFMSSFLLNCVAYEQCHKSCSKHFTTYATFLDCLVNTYRDVEYLIDHDIVENYFGNDGEVARFVNNMGKDVAVDLDICYLAALFNDVHHYYKNSWHVTLAGFKYTYFATPWSFISALAALVLLLLTVAQTYFSIYGAFKH